MAFNCFKDKPRPVTRDPKPSLPKPDGTIDPPSKFHLAIVVGHNERAQGANNYLGESEWVFNKRIAYKLISKLEVLGIRSSIIFRPKSGGYRHECRYVKGRIKELGCTHAMLLHFNAAGASARGCEVLISHRRGGAFADSISDRLNESLGIKERHDDGVKMVYSGHNGFVMINGIDSLGVVTVLVEPCFGGYRTTESEAIFEDEDRYVSILAEATKGEAV
jgi:hypothetical protein